MTLQVSVAESRTFYIERYGATYTVVRVWEPGAALEQRDLAQIFSRVMSSAPDERIIATQQVSIQSDGEGRVQIVSEDARTAAGVAAVTARMIKGERLPQAREDRADEGT